MRCSEPGGSGAVAVIASRVPGRWAIRRQRAFMDSSETFPPNRPRVFLAFLLCFVWQIILVDWLSQWLHSFSEMRFFIGFIPLLAAMAILYPSDAFRKYRPPFRIGMLFLFSVVLMICAFALLAASAVLLFAIGAVSPE